MCTYIGFPWWWSNKPRNTEPSQTDRLFFPPNLLVSGYTRLYQHQFAVGAFCAGIWCDSSRGDEGSRGGEARAQSKSMCYLCFP